MDAQCKAARLALRTATDTNAVSHEEFASLQEKMDKILEALGEGKK